MSFSYDIKTKLAQQNTECEFCKLAELYGIVSFSSSKKSGKLTIITEHKPTADKICELFKECIGYLPGQKEYIGGYKFEIEDGIKKDILEDKLYLNCDGQEILEDIMPFSCCKCAYIRGAFIGGGSISDPNKNYHLEFDSKREDAVDNLIKILREEGIHLKKAKRKSHFIAYVKGYEEIASLMGIIGAGSASMEIYNISIEKEIRNDVNRKINCENANMDKIVKAYGKHMLAIEKINNTIGFESLPKTLAEIARVRLEYPDESLKELGTRLENPIGKSGVNHRLNRLIEIADKL